MLNNYGLYKNYRDNNMEPIVEYLNKILKKYGNRVTSKEAVYTLENLPNLSEVKPNRVLNPDKFHETEEKQWELDSTNKKEENNEFEKLLNEFINSASEKDVSQQ